MTIDSNILRLRKANPVPRPESVDASELFERITSLPPDSRARRRATTHRRRALVLALSLAVMAILASTAFAISSWVVGGAVEPPVTLAEYRAAQSQLTLPPGSSWPVLHIDANSVTSPGAGGGHAVLIAQNAWECYWVRAIRNQDAAAQERAQSELHVLLANNIMEAPAGAPEDWTPPNVPTVPFVAYAHDGGLAWIRQTYRLAAAGDPGRLIQSCRANAPG